MNFFKKNEPYSKGKCLGAAFISAMALFVEFNTTDPSESHIGRALIRGLFKLFEQVTETFKGSAFIITLVALLLFFVYRTFLGDDKRRLLPIRRERLLSFFFSFMYTGGRAFRYGNTLKVLIFPRFNIIKTLIIFVGFYFLFILFIRTINYLLENAYSIFKIDTDKFSKIRAIYRKHPYLFIWIAILLSWFIHLICRYPAALGDDDWNQLCFYFGIKQFTSWQPMFHTWLYGSFVDMGMKLFGSANLGLFIYRFVESGIMAAVLAYTVYMMYQWRIPFWYRLFVMVLYCFTPYFSGNAAWVIKDYPHMIGYIIWSLCIIHIVQRKDLSFSFKRDYKLLLMWTYGAAFMALCRKNGLHIYLVMSIILGIIWVVMILKKKEKFTLYPVVMFVLPLIIVTSINNAITVKFDVVEGSIREAFCLPFQQTARYVRDYYDELTDEELEVLQDVFDWRYFPTSYDPLCADDIKSLYIDGDKARLIPYIKVWINQFFKHPMCYVEATWNQNYFMFMPDFDNVVYNRDCDAGKGVVPDRDFIEWTGIEVPEAMQGLPIMICSMYRMLNQFPVIALMNNLAVYVFVLFILLSLMKEHGYKKERITLIPMWLSLLFVLMSPLLIDQPRYSWAVIYILPTVVAMYMFMREGNRNAE